MVTLFLSIRNFHAQLASTYAREPRAPPPPEGGFEAIRARGLAKPPSWFEFAWRIRAAEALPRHLPAPERRRIVDEIFAAAGPGTRIVPFSPAEIRVIDKSHTADCARMRDLDPEMRMRF